MTASIDLLCLGNPCADVVIRCERVPGWDDKSPGIALGTFAGATESNVACAASRLGWHAAVLGSVGDDAHAAFLVEAFRRDGVDLRWLARVPQSASASTVILLSPEGERSIVWVPMARELGPPERLEAAVAASRIVYTMPYGIDELELLRELTHRHGAELAIDIEAQMVGEPGALKRILGLCDVAFMNASAFRVGMRCEPELPLLRRLAASSRVRMLVVSLGAHGAMAAGGAQQAAVPARAVEVVDTTGAGDTFNAAFLVARGRGMDVADALHFGCAAASHTVAALGARGGLPTFEQVSASLQSDRAEALCDVIDFAALPRECLPALLRTMPKAELHIHIEGSLEPELIFELAQRNGVALAYPDVESLRAAYAFSDLQSFLDIYYAGASVLLTEDDFFAMAMAYFRRAAADGVVRAELFFDPQTHTDRGVPMGAVISGLARACRQAKYNWGISGALILCFLRHLSEESAFTTLKAALPYREHLIGVGLDSSERGNPPEKFARVFAKCRELGLHLVAHAGEEGPPAYVWSALDVLHVERIDHGVRSIEDQVLMQRLAASRVPLTVCPLSNVKLCVFDELSKHNLGALLDAGLCVTVNSDDPAYFGGYLAENFVEIFAALPELDARHAYTLARNSLDASFATPAEKAVWFEQLDDAFKTALGSVAS